MRYQGTAMSDAIAVTEIYTVLRSDIAKNYPGCGEEHPFPEIFYLSRGKHTLLIDRVPYTLTAGQMILYAPRSYHEASEIVPTLAQAAVLTFDASSDFLPTLYNTVITLTDRQKRLLEAFIDEGIALFRGRAPEDEIKGMVLREGVDEAGLWSLKKQIEIFLIDVYKNRTATDNRGKAARWDRELSEILSYLEAHLCDPLTLERIARANSVSVSKLKMLFRERLGTGPIEYLIQARIDRAQSMILEGSLSMTEIAEALGFSSVHYFSRLFKRVTGMSPSEYKRR